MHSASDYGYVTNQQACAACGSFGADQCCDGNGHKYTSAIDWPNGKGYTPCTAEYAERMAERDAVYSHAPGRSLDDLSPEDYEKWHRLDMALNPMRAAGHVGRPVRF
jgi:hypothetical protein